MPANRFGGFGHYCTSASSGGTASYRVNYSTPTSASGTVCTWSDNGERWVTGTTSTTSDSYTWHRLGTREQLVYARGPHRLAGFGNHDELPRKRAKEREKIDKRANKLLKQWLSEMEYNYLMEQGQLELPSQYEKNVIYIVKKDPNRKVVIAQQQKISCLHKPMVIYTGEACIHIDSAYPDGDRLLANIALLKSDEKKFLKTANISVVGRPFGAGISIRDFAGLLIREVPGTNFWFVQFDMDNAERPDSVNHCHETERTLQFPQQAQVVSSEKYNNTFNNVMLPSVGQYFINADNMEEAVQIARNWRRLHAAELERHVQDAAQIAEEEYAGGVTIRWDTHDDPQSPFLTYATTGEGAHDER